MKLIQIFQCQNDMNISKDEYVEMNETKLANLNLLNNQFSIFSFI